MNTLFDNDCRYLTDGELLYNITNSRETAAQYVREEVIDIEQLFASLTPARRQVAMAAVEMYKRAQLQKQQRATIRTSKDIYLQLAPMVADLPHEEFWIIALNQAAKVLKKVRISTGNIDSTTADIRLIMRVLIEVRATSFIAAHNHPSGNVNPSVEDRRLTESMRQAGKTMNITMLDHVIIADASYYSFADEGLIGY
jgi:DNA repair protein RadC